MKIGLWNSLRKSLLNKIIILFIIFLIPIYILGSIIFSWSLENTKEKIINSEITQLKYYNDKFEKEIERISKIQYEFWNDRDLLTISSFGDSLNLYEFQSALKNIQQRIIFLKNTSEYVANSSITMFNVNKKVSTSDGITQYTTHEPQDSETPKNDFRKNVSNSLFDWNGDNLIINVKGPIFYSAENYNMPFIVQVEISSESILNDFRQFDVINNYDKGLTALLDKSNQYQIINGSTELAGFPFKVMDDKYKDIGQGYISSEYNGKVNYEIFVRSKFLNTVIVRVIPEAYFLSQFKKYVVWFAVFSVVSLSIIVLFFLMIFKQVIEPLQKVVHAFEEVENGNMDIIIRHNKHDEFSFLYKGFNKMIENIKSLFEQVYRHKVLAQQAEMKRLQSQINPHFLYNSFYNLHRLAKMDDSESVADFTYKLANYYQFITRNAEDEVTLEKEAGYAKIYTEIQGMRFNSRIKVEFGKVPDEMKNFSIPRMILQPVIENAFEHGLKNKVRDGLIKIDFLQVESGIIISIEDNGDEITDEDIATLAGKLESEDRSEETTAMINIHRRLNMRFGNKSGIYVSRGRLNGLCVNIQIFIKEVLNVQAINS